MVLTIKQTSAPANTKFQHARCKTRAKSLRSAPGTGRLAGRQPELRREILRRGEPQSQGNRSNRLPSSQPLLRGLDPAGIAESERRQPGQAFEREDERADGKTSLCRGLVQDKRDCGITLDFPDKGLDPLVGAGHFPNNSRGIHHGQKQIKSSSPQPQATLRGSRYFFVIDIEETLESLPYTICRGEASLRKR